MLDNLADILVAGRTLTASDVLALRERLEPAWRLRERRLAARDQAVREAEKLYDFATANARAKALATDLERIIAGGPVVHREAAQRILTLSDGKLISRSQIRRIAAYGKRR